jgi:hypothetical protein
MGTDDSDYELAVCHQLGKAAKLRTGTRFTTDLSTNLSTVLVATTDPTGSRQLSELGTGAFEASRRTAATPAPNRA